MQGKFVKYERNLLDSIGYTQDAPTICYGDNLSAEKMANHSKPCGRSRHIDIQWYTVQEWVKRGLMILRHVGTHLNPADAFTKILGWVLHHRHCDEVMGNNGPKYKTYDE